jgi:hypothetical protein
MKTKKLRTRPRKLDAERILDVLLDISIRHRRGDTTSVSQIFKDNHVDQSLHQDLLHVGFVRKEGKRNVYTEMMPTLEIAEAVMDAYRERTQTLESAYEEEEDDEHTSKLEAEVLVAVREMSQVMKALYKELTGRSLILKHESQQEKETSSESGVYRSRDSTDVRLGE